MDWLITGGCGFIGTCLVSDLVSEGGHSIRILDNLSVGTREDLEQVCDFVELDSNLQPIQGTGGAVHLIAGDILDERLVLKAAKDIDVIVHLAANTGVASSTMDPRSDCLTNVVGTLNCLEAARHNRVKRFILASSGATIGECEPPIHEESTPHPVSPYGASKLSGEAYCRAYHGTFGVETVALRFGNVYGPLSSHKDSVVARFIARALEGKELEIYGNGRQTRDFIFSEDLIRAVRSAASMPGIGGETFQIGTNAETTVAEIAQKLVTILDRAGIKDVVVTNTSPRQGDVFRNYADTSKAKRLLGWHARVDLSDGLQRVVEWFVRAKGLDC